MIVKRVLDQTLQEIRTQGSTNDTYDFSVSVMTFPLFRPADLWRMRLNTKSRPRESTKNSENRDCHRRAHFFLYRAFFVTVPGLL